MKTTTDSAPPHVPWLGTACCLAAAVGYTGANICLRQLAEIKADPASVICLKETTAVVLLCPWLLWRLALGERGAVQPRALSILILVALAVQLVGNLGIQWSLGVVGLVISLPRVFGALLVGSAVIGMTLFHESLSRRSFVAVVAVVGSIVLLSVGATGRHDTSVDMSGLLLTVSAMAAAGAGGTAFAGLGAALRYASTARIPITVTVVVVTGTGTLSLGTLCLLRLGPTEMLATDPTVLAWIVASGLCNVVAFSLINKGIQLTTLVHANLLNASQVALGSLAGVLLFHEPYNGFLVGGIVLTIIGIGLFGKPRRS